MHLFPNAVDISFQMFYSVFQETRPELVWFRQILLALLVDEGPIIANSYTNIEIEKAYREKETPISLYLDNRTALRDWCLVGSICLFNPTKRLRIRYVVRILRIEIPW